MLEKHIKSRPTDIYLPTILALKKMENHCYAKALRFVYYNFGKIVTPAMEAWLTKDVMSIKEIIRLSD